MTGGSDVFFKCENSNERLQTIWKIKENLTSQKEHNNFPLTKPKKWRSATCLIKNSK